MAQITVEEFRNFFKYYKGEEHQQRAVEMLYEDINHHLDEDSAWIKQYRTPDKAPAGEPCLLYTSPSPRDLSTSRMPSSA